MTGYIGIPKGSTLTIPMGSIVENIHFEQIAGTNPAYITNIKNPKGNKTNMATTKTITMTKADPRVSISMNKNGFGADLRLNEVYNPHRYDEDMCGCPTTISNQVEVDLENKRRGDLSGYYAFETVDTMAAWLKTVLV